MKKFRKRYPFYALVIAFSIVVIFLPKIYSIVEPFNLINLAEEKLSYMTGYDVHIMWLKVEFRGGFNIKGRRIVMLDGQKLVGKVDDVSLNISLMELLAKRIDIEEALVDGLSMRFIVPEKKEKKPFKWEIGKKIIDNLGNVDIGNVTITNSWVMVCRDEENVYVSDCYTASSVSTSFSVKGVDIALDNFSSDIMLPWYGGRFEVGLSGKVKLGEKSFVADGKLSLNVPSLEVRDKWADSGYEYPETTGEIKIQAETVWDGGKLDVKGQVESRDLVFGYKDIAASGSRLKIAVDGIWKGSLYKGKAGVKATGFDLSMKNVSARGADIDTTVDGEWNRGKVSGKVVFTAGVADVRYEGTSFYAEKVKAGVDGTARKNFFKGKGSFRGDSLRAEGGPGSFSGDKVDIFAQVGWDDGLYGIIYGVSGSGLAVESEEGDFNVANFDVNSNGKWDGRVFSGDANIKSSRLDAKYGKRKYKIKNLHASSPFYLDGEKLSIERPEISFGAPEAATLLSGRGEFLLGENTMATPERRYKVNNIDAEIELKTKDAREFGVFTGGLNWPLGGEISASATVKGDPKNATGHVEADGKDVRIYIPEKYGKRGALVSSGKVRLDYKLDGDKLSISDLNASLGTSQAQAVATVKLDGYEPIFMTSKVKLPKVSLNDIRPLFPKENLSEKSRRFFFTEFQNGTANDIEGTLTWKKGWRKNDFVYNGITAKGVITSADLDLGNAPISVDRADATFSGGDLEIRNIVANMCGAPISRGHIEIKSVAKDTWLEVYSEEKVPAESILRILRADAVGIEDILDGIFTKGWITPSAVIRIHLEKGARDHSIDGKAIVSGMSLSVAGIVPLMENVNGTLTFQGHKIVSDRIDYTVGDFAGRTSIHVPEFMEPVADFHIFMPDIRPGKIMDKVPPKGSGEAPGEKKPSEVELKAKKRMRITLFIKADKGKFKTRPFTDLDAEVVIRDGFARARKLNFGIAEGRFRLQNNMFIDLESKAVDMDFILENVDVYDLMKMLEIKKELIRGDLQAEGHITFSGATMDEIVKTLSGKVRFKLRDGSIEESNLLFKIFNTINLDFSNWKARKMGYRRINGRFTLDNGLMDLKNVAMNGFFVRIAGAGEINLRKSTFEVDVGLIPLGALEKALGNTKLFGYLLRTETGKSLIGYYFRVKGTFSDYEVVQLGPTGVQEKLVSAVKTLLMEE